MQKLLKTFFDFYLKSSIHVALSVVALAKISLLVANFKTEPSLLIFIFLGALSAYNFIKFFPLISSQNLGNEDWVIVSLTLVAMISCMVLFFTMSYLAVGFVLLGGILVLGYAIPFYASATNWRGKKGWKLNLVVMSWICLTVGVPLAYVELFDTVLFLKLAVLQGIYIFVAVLPFEIGDLNTDDKCLQTLPQRFGIVTVKKMGSVILVLGYLITVFNFGIATGISLSTLCVFLILGYGLWKSNENQSPYFARFWIEALPILWCLLIYYF